MKKNQQTKKWLVSLLMLLLCSTATLMAQVTIKGVVVDVLGEPVIGANVLEVGTQNGVVTDMDGNFVLTVAKVGAKLQVSYIGYKTIELPAMAKPMSIILEEDTEVLDDVVVVGYGVTKRKNFTGSVTTVNVSEGGVALTAPTNPTDLLRGATPGLTMSQSGVAGSSPSIQVRGQKSINGGSQPLIVLDGVIFKGSINDIDPSIVESMSVLKDATSLAAYGSQAANGVIMITTKKGVQGKPMINFQTSVALSTPNYRPELRDGAGYIELMAAREGFDPKDLSWLSPLELANVKAGKEYDWTDFIVQTGVRQNYSLNISGGADKLDYMFGASLMDNKNFIKGNTFKRNTVNGRINARINNYIKTSLTFNYADQQMDGIRPYSSRYYSPWAEPYLSDGKTLRKYMETNNFSENPLWDVDNGIDHEVRNNSTTVGGEIEIRLPWIKGLSYKVTGNYTLRNLQTRHFEHETNLFTDTYAEVYSSDMTDQYLNLANGYINTQKNTSYVIDNILTYTKEFGRNFLSATLVYTRDSNKMDGHQEEGSDYSSIGNTTLGFYGLNNADSQKISSISYQLHNDVGYLGRINYSYNDTYHFNASVRRDGSSVFGADKKWGTFPAFGFAWSFTNEEFMKDVKWISNAKIKASWGKNGNQSLDPYGTLSTVNMGQSGGVAYFFGNDIYYGQSLATIGNPALGWETTTSWNFGLEADLLKNGRLHFETDVYTANTTDQIFDRTIPSMGAGISSQKSTMGEIKNWGIEASLRSTNIRTKSFMWTSTLQFTMSRSILKDLYGDGNDDIANELFLNKSLGAIYGYKFLRVTQKSDTEYIAKTGFQPGDPFYEDVNGDGLITPDADRQILGYNKEAFRMSLANTLNYKNWSLYFLFNGVFSGGLYGKAINNNAYVSFENMKYNNAENHPFWTEENPSNKYLKPRAQTTDLRALQSYGFVRLQDLNLSYRFDGALLKKIGIAGLQVYVSGQNLFFIAPNWEFSDPEVRSSRSTQLARTYTFGLNLRF